MCLHTLLDGPEDGHPLVLLHGLLGSAASGWNVAGGESIPALSFCAPAEKPWRVIRVDLPNHGDSPRQKTFTLESVAEDVKETVTALGYGSAVFCGHSMGGKVAMQLACAFPSFVERLVVLDMSPRAFPPFHLFLLRVCKDLPVAMAADMRPIDEKLAVLAPKARDRAYVLKNLEPDGAGHFRWKCDLDNLIANYKVVSEAGLSGKPYPGKARFIMCGASPFKFWRDEALIKEYFPKAEIETLAGVDHLGVITAG